MQLQVTARMSRSPAWADRPMEARARKRAAQRMRRRRTAGPSQARSRLASGDPGPANAGWSTGQDCEMSIRFRARSRTQKTERKPTCNPSSPPGGTDLARGTEDPVDHEEQDHAGAVEQQPEHAQGVDSILAGFVHGGAGRGPLPSEAGPGQEQGVGQQEEGAGEDVPGEAHLAVGLGANGLGHQLDGDHRDQPPHEVKQED